MRYPCNLDFCVQRCNAHVTSRNVSLLFDAACNVYQSRNIFDYPFSRIRLLRLEGGATRKSVKRTNQRLRLERVTRGRLRADNRYQLTTTWCCGIPNLGTHTQLRAYTTRSYVSDADVGVNARNLILSCSHLFQSFTRARSRSIDREINRDG